MAPRMRKGRFCRPLRGGSIFLKPRRIPLSSLEVLELGHDELEAMRLCDFEGLDQEAAALKMQISRGTLQRLLYAGRKKLVESLIFNKGLKVIGGDHILGKGGE